MKKATQFSLMLLALTAIAPVIMAAGGDRAFASTRFALELDGQFAGYVKSVQGGFPKAQVMTQKVGPDGIAHKNIAAVTYEPFEIEVGMSMGKGLQEWIQASWNGESMRKNGAVLALDMNGKEMARREFTDALISEVSLPRLDASDKNPAYMTIKIQPETTRYGKGSGKVVQGDAAPKQKQWLPSNFRLELDGMDTSRVTKIDGFSVKQQVIREAVGGMRVVKSSGSIEFPNLSIYVPMTDSDPWMEWMEDFMIKGNNGQDRELSGRIVFLAPDGSTELGRVELEQVGIFGMAYADAEAGADTIGKVKAQLYVEKMELTLK